MSIGSIAGTLRPEERRGAAGLAAAVGALHVAGFGLAVALVAGHGGGSGAIGLGVAMTAYALGLRHALDADHLAAIDATTRKLVHEGRRPLGVGFCFSLGHATVVLALALLVAGGVHGLDGALRDGGSSLHRTMAVAGPAVSGSVLLLIGLLNLVVLVGMVGVLRRARAGVLGAHEVDAGLAPGGIMTRLYGRATRAVRRPRHVYLLGLAFGLGFDTATEVALLVLAGGAAAGGVPLPAVLCLPLLFAAGMSLLDTVDGALMRAAYGWASVHPLRRLSYNVAITGLSVAVALAVGAVELLSAVAGRLGLTGGVWDGVARLDPTMMGCVLTAALVLTWAAAVVLWRRGARCEA